MAWCDDGDDDRYGVRVGGRKSSPAPPTGKTCPSCGHRIHTRDDQGGRAIQDLPGRLPAGVKFDPSDQELLEHLEGKARPDLLKLHPLIDEFIPTIEGDNGICYTHPEKLPGVTRDGRIRHFFHRPSKAYTTGTRKRRKVTTDEQGDETRWHKTGKTRPVFSVGRVKGYKKILVLYTNYGKQKKPEKTNWVMHQYHLGSAEDEKEGEIVVSKIFYQTQPRQCGSLAMVKDPQPLSKGFNGDREGNNINVDCYGASVLISYSQGGRNRDANSSYLNPSFNVDPGASPILR